MNAAIVSIRAKYDRKYDVNGYNDVRSQRNIDEFGVIYTVKTIRSKTKSISSLES